MTADETPAPEITPQTVHWIDFTSDFIRLLPSERQEKMKNIIYVFDKSSFDSDISAEERALAKKLYKEKYNRPIGQLTGRREILNLAFCGLGMLAGAIGMHDADQKRPDTTDPEEVQETTRLIKTQGAASGLLGTGSLVAGTALSAKILGCRSFYRYVQSLARQQSTQLER